MDRDSRNRRNEKATIVRIALLHTADVHVATFDQIFADLGIDVVLDHHVHPDLLDRARRGGLDSVRSEVQTTLMTLACADAVLCTCSTLGPLVDEVALSFPHILRIDRPLMEKASGDGNRILVAICLESTRDATFALLTACAAKTGRKIDAALVVCTDAWAFFEAGDMDAYAQSIAATIKAEVAKHPNIDGIVLAQASMRVAETALEDMGIPVRSAPVIAAQRCIAVARKAG